MNEMMVEHNTMFRRTLWSEVRATARPSLCEESLSGAPAIEVKKNV